MLNYFKSLNDAKFWRYVYKDNISKKPKIKLSKKTIKSRDLP